MNEKLILPISIVLGFIILGSFYYITRANQQKFTERQQELIKQEQGTKELKERELKNEIKLALDGCISDAEESYINRWHEECSSMLELREKIIGGSTNKCLDVLGLNLPEYLEKHKLTTREYIKQRGLEDEFLSYIPTDKPSFNLEEFELVFATLDFMSRADEECSCRLTFDKSDRLNEGLEKDKEECFKRYPQN